MHAMAWVGLYIHVCTHIYPMGKAVFEVVTLGWAGPDVLQGLVLVGPLFSVTLPSQCLVSGISAHLRVGEPCSSAFLL